MNLAAVMMVAGLYKFFESPNLPTSEQHRVFPNLVTAIFKSRWRRTPTLNGKTQPSQTSQQRRESLHQMGV
jgi:hypothetical protein